MNRGTRVLSCLVPAILLSTTLLAACGGGAPSPAAAPLAPDQASVLPRAGQPSASRNALVTSGGSLSGTGDSTATASNLTTEGTADWVHWSAAGVDRRTGVAAQLSTYSIVGSGSPQPYPNDPRPLSWTDGAPNASSANDLNGVFINAMGSGFSLTAPADLDQRTLTVHVGGWNSGGTLTAHLSDGSASDYVDVAAGSGGQYDRNYALTYHAGNAAQTLTVAWKYTSGLGNVTLSGAALSGAAAVSGINVRASAGTPQSAVVNTAFSTPLQAKVTDAANNPVIGTTVVFTAPASGPSGTFAGAPTVSAVTDGTGGATAPTFTANGTAGAAVVTASVSGGATTGSFSLTNNPPAGTGSLSGSADGAANSANLTGEGGVDWMHFGDASAERKAGVTPRLGNVAVVGGAAATAYDNDPRPMSWTNGTPLASTINDTKGIFVGGVNNGFSTTAPADSTLRTLSVHVGGWNSAGRLTAHLSDGSSPDYVDTTAGAGGQYDRNYRLSYRAATDGQTLTVTWQMASGLGNVTFNALALDGPTPSGAMVVTISGLPNGTAANVQMTGPGYSSPLTASQTLVQLTPGSYQLAAADVVVGSLTYKPSPANQSIAVAAGTSSGATVGYWAGSAGSAGCGLSGKPTGDFHMTTTDGNGATRDFEVMVPASYDPASAYPLTFVYHGLNGSEAVAKSYGIQDAPGATASGIFVFPLSADPSGTTWVDSCAGKDVRFFDNMLAAIKANYCIKSSRVFVAGFSWGCDHATGLVSCRGDRIRAASLASCTDEFASSDYRSYLNLPTPVTVNTAARFTHDANGDQYYSQLAFQNTSALLRSFNSCSSTSSLVSPSPCVSYGSCTNPVIECSYGGLGHTLPAGWGSDTWTFFNGFQ
jgi:poly(3-hydroxybutyrate) depolymerase